MEEGAERGRWRQPEDDSRCVEDSDVGYGHGSTRRHRRGAGYRRRRGGVEARRRRHLAPMKRASLKVAHWILDSSEEEREMGRWSEEKDAGAGGGGG